MSHCVDSRHFPELGFDRAVTMGFTVYTEEFGVVGAVVLIALVLALSLRGLQIAARAQGFARFAALGLSLMLFGSAFLHIASLTHLLDESVFGSPLSPQGLALPLVGAGGNVMAINLIAIGLLYRFGRSASPPGPPPAPAQTSTARTRNRGLRVVAGLLIVASALLVARTLDLQRGEYGYGKGGSPALTCRANERISIERAQRNDAQQRTLATERLLLWLAQLQTFETTPPPRLLAEDEPVDFRPVMPIASGGVAGEPSAGAEEPGAPPRWLQASLSGILNSPFPPPSRPEDLAGEPWTSHRDPDLDGWCAELGTRKLAACLDAMAPELVPWLSTLDDSAKRAGLRRALSATDAVRRILRSRADGDSHAPGLEIASVPPRSDIHLVAVAFPDTRPTCGRGACRTPTLLYRVTTAPDGQETPTLILISTQDHLELDPDTWFWDDFNLFAYSRQHDGIDVQIDSIDLYRCERVCWPTADRRLETRRHPDRVWLDP